MAEEKSNETFSIENIDFVFRRPWLITAAFLLLFNAFQAYSTTIAALYNTQAVLLFESASSAKARRDVINEKKVAAEKILTGSNVDTILEVVVKDKPESERKADYERLRSKLLSSKDGLRFKWEEKGIGYLLNINFEYGDASDCYNTVKAAMNTIIQESEQEFTREMEAELLFLKKQLKFYKDRLSEIDAETEDTRQELISRYSELSPDEREVVLKFYDKAGMSKKEGSSDTDAADSGVIKLKKDLVDFKNRRKKLQTSLDDGTFMTQSIIADIDEEDLFIREYKRAITSKEMEIDSLLSRGYKEEHPQVKQLREEVNRSKEIRKKRLERLKPENLGGVDYEETRQRVNLEIKGLDIKIALILDNLKNIEAASPNAAENNKKISPSQGPTKDLISRLSNLAGEKTVNETYYQEMRKNLANAELKHRAENEAVGFKISVVKEPTLPIIPDSSKARDVALRGFISALLIALGIGYISYKIKDAVHSEHELGDLLGIPVIASIDSLLTKSEVASQNLRFKYTAITVVTIMVLTRIIIAAIYLPRT